MSYRRVVVRCDNTSDLDQSAQAEFVGDTHDRLDGSGIRGYFVAGTGTNWIEWEGTATEIDDKLGEHFNDPRVGEYTILEDTLIPSIDHEMWVGHCEACAMETLD